MRDERGASLVEYTLLVGLIVLLSIVALGVIGGDVSSKLSRAGSLVDN